MNWVVKVIINYIYRYWSECINVYCFFLLVVLINVSKVVRSCD
jgi:hypothetical protein